MEVEALRPRSNFVSVFVKQHFVSLVLAALCFVLVKSVLIWFRRYLHLRRIPGPDDTFPPTYLVKELGPKLFTVRRADITHEIACTIRHVVATYARPNEGIIKIYLGFTPLVILSDAHCAELLLTDNVNISKPMSYKFLDRWIGGSLLTSTGDFWRFQRKLMTPAFHFKILDNYMGIFNKQASNFVTFLNEKLDQKEIRLFKEASKCTLNIIGETTLGYDLDAMSGDNAYGKALSTLQLLVLVRSIRPWMWFDSLYYKLTAEGSLAMKCINAMHGFSTHILNQRKQEAADLKKKTEETDLKTAPQPIDKNKPRTLLEILLDYHHQDSKLVTEDLIRSEVDTMLFAGQDTTATSISWTTYLLGLNLDMQEKCRQEMFRILGPDPNTPVDSEKLKLMKYTEACIKESMRLFPPIPMIGRKLQSNMKIRGNEKKPFIVPAGVQVFLSIFHVHRDPKYFPDPEKFDPERFLDENAPHKSHPFAYVPFSGGPRNCIGQKFAALEIKVVLAHMLRNFKWTSLRATEDLKIAFEVVLRAKGDLRVKLEPLRPTTDTPQSTPL